MIAILFFNHQNNQNMYKTTLSIYKNFMIQTCCQNPKLKEELTQGWMPQLMTDHLSILTVPGVITHGVPFF